MTVKGTDSTPSPNVYNQQSIAPPTTPASSYVGRTFAKNTSTSTSSRLLGIFSKSSSNLKRTQNTGASESSLNASSISSKPTRWQKFTNLFKRNVSAPTTTESKEPQTTQSKPTLNLNSNNNLAAENLRKKVNSEIDANANKSVDPEAENIKNNIKSLEKGNYAGIYPLYKTEAGKAALEEAAKSGYYSEHTQFFEDFRSLEQMIEKENALIKEGKGTREGIENIKEKFSNIIEKYIRENKTNISDVQQAALLKFANQINSHEFLYDTELKEMQSKLEGVKTQSERMVAPLFKNSPSLKNLNKQFGIE